MLLKNLSTIQKSTLLILFVTGLIKIPLVLKDIAMAGYFGVDRNMDIYLYALVVPTFLAAIATASFSYFLIPSYLKIKTQHGAAQARQYIEQFFFSTILLTTALIVITGLLIPHFLINFNLKLFVDQETINRFLIFSFFVSIFVGLQLISLLLTFLLQAEHHYMRSLIPQTFAPLACIIMLILYGEEWGIIAAVYGSLLGIILNLCCLFFLSYRLKLIGWPQPHQGLTTIKTDYSQFWILNLAFIMPALMSVIDQQMALSLGEGQLTALTYSIRIPDGISEILCAGLGTAVFSHFSEWASQNDHQKLRESLQKVIIFSTLLIIPISTFIFLYAYPIVSLLFERGAFTVAAAHNVSQIMQFYCFTIYFTVLATVGAKAISAIGKNNFFLGFAVTICTLKVLFNFILIKPLGLNGLALATVLTLIINCTLIFRFLSKNGITIFNKFFINCLLKYLLFTAIFLIILIGVRTITVDFQPMLQVLVALFVSITLLGVFLKINSKEDSFFKLPVS